MQPYYLKDTDLNVQISKSKNTLIFAETSSTLCLCMLKDLKKGTDKTFVISMFQMTRVQIYSMSVYFTFLFTISLVLSKFFKLCFIFVYYIEMLKIMYTALCNDGLFFFYSLTIGNEKCMNNTSCYNCYTLHVYTRRFFFLYIRFFSLCVREYII